MRVLSLWIATALTLSASLASAVPITNGLVVAYEFSGNADDSSGNGNHGVINGGVSLATDRFGNANSAFYFDGVDGYVNSSQTFSPQSEGLISLWFRADHDAVGGTGIASSRSDYGYLDGDWIVEIGSNLEVYYWNGAGGWNGPGGISRPSLEEWHHLALSWDVTSGSTTYLDGNPVGSSPVPVPLFGNIDLDIGRDALVHSSTCCALYFPGSIDDVFVYDRALSEAEVQTLYSYVPEPSAALLLGLGLSALAVRRGE